MLLILFIGVDLEFTLLATLRRKMRCRKPFRFWDKLELDITELDG